MEVRDIIKELDRREQVSWVPACGGTEEPFTKAGRTYLYMFNTFTKKHAYYCQTSDLFLSDDEALDLFSN